MLSIPITFQHWTNWLDVEKQNLNKYNIFKKNHWFDLSYY